MRKIPGSRHPAVARDPELNALFNPSQAFGHPMEVVSDDDLTLYEKRAILSSWASQACAVNSSQGLLGGAGNKTVLFDDIVDALKILEEETKATWKIKKSQIGNRRRNEGSGSSPLM